VFGFVAEHRASLVPRETKEEVSMEKELLDKYYYIEVQPDPNYPPRRDLNMLVAVVYKTSTSVRDDWNLHLTWYSSPDSEEYNTWSFSYLLLHSENLEILSETALLAEIMAITEETQPQDFEVVLQKLGFSRQRS
jgi:hypothetical protein